MPKFAINKIDISVSTATEFVDNSYILQNYVTGSLSGEQGWVIRESASSYFFEFWLGENRTYNNAKYGTVTTIAGPTKTVWVYFKFDNIDIISLRSNVSKNAIQISFPKEIFEI